MSTETLMQIAQIAKADISNPQIAQILTSYESQITQWLTSSEFAASHWASKLYPPLLNPECIDYTYMDIIHAWVLNLPLPKHYDFIAFGSAFSGLKKASSFLMLCGAHSISTAGISSSFECYMHFYKNILIYADMKEKEEISYSFLELNDFILDEDTQKLYSLLDASKALHVVADPISTLRASLCTSKLSTDFALGLADEPKTALQAGLQAPNSDINSHLSNIKELYHDGFMFNLLSSSMKNICLKQNSDFSPDKAFATTCEIASTLGLKAPEKNSAFNADPELFSGLLPLKICVDNELCLYLTTCYESEFGIFRDNDISPAFSLAEPSMRVLLAKPDDALIFLKNKELFAKTKERVELASKAILELTNSFKTSISEAEILEFLLTQAESRKLARDILAQHLMILKQVAPALVQSFTRYQAFELLCAKDD